MVLPSVLTAGLFIISMVTSREGRLPGWGLMTRPRRSRGYFKTNSCQTQKPVDVEGVRTSDANAGLRSQWGREHGNETRRHLPRGLSLFILNEPIRREFVAPSTGKHITARSECNCTPPVRFGGIAVRSMCWERTDPNWRLFQARASSSVLPKSGPRRTSLREKSTRNSVIPRDPGRA